EAADVLVIKVQSLGGVVPAMRVIESSGLPAIVSSMVETSVGISAGIALAAALRDLPYPCGLGTVPLLDGDLVADSLVPVDGAVAVRRPEVDPALLARYAGPDFTEAGGSRP
ncbi:MAG TPA: O-succinylbenzoate synthase, partial [Actinomycetota bacterium]|nr:O-succinylbenzoate synthase [Actinomycetota bacterium]